MIESRLVDPFDRAVPLLRLNSWSLEAANSNGDLEPQRHRHAQVLHGWFVKRTGCPELREVSLAEVPPAFERLSAADWRMAAELAQSAFSFLRDRGRLVEAAQLLGELSQAAAVRQDERVVEFCNWEFSWLPEWRFWRAGPSTLTGEQMTLDFGLR